MTGSLSYYITFLLAQQDPVLLLFIGPGFLNEDKVKVLHLIQSKLPAMVQVYFKSHYMDAVVVVMNVKVGKRTDGRP